MSTHATARFSIGQPGNTPDLDPQAPDEFLEVGLLPPETVWIGRITDQGQHLRDLVVVFRLELGVTENLFRPRGEIFERDEAIEVILQTPAKVESSQHVRSMGQAVPRPQRSA